MCLGVWNRTQPQQNCISSTPSSLSHFSTGTVIHLVLVQAKCLGVSIVSDFPGAYSKELACQSRGRKRCKFDPWVWKIPWRRAWQPTPVFLPGESHGQRSLVGHSPCRHQESVSQICLFSFFPNFLVQVSMVSTWCLFLDSCSPWIHSLCVSLLLQNPWKVPSHLGNPLSLFQLSKSYTCLLLWAAFVVLSLPSLLWPHAKRLCT